MEGALLRAGVIMVTMASAAAARRAAAAGDVGSAAFVAASLAALLLLFRRLQAYERLPAGREDDGRRARLRRHVWALCTLLTALFAWKVAGAMPSWPAAAAVWAMAAVTVAGGFVALFVHHHRRP
ncbi:hypothetical protein ACP4OV_017041 [Aristida adscensionis]